MPPVSGLVVRDWDPGLGERSRGGGEVAKNSAAALAGARFARSARGWRRDRAVGVLRRRRRSA